MTAVVLVVQVADCSSFPVCSIDDIKLLVVVIVVVVVVVVVIIIIIIISEVQNQEEVQ